MKTVPTIMIAVACTACTPEPTMSMSTSPDAIAATDDVRVEVIRLGVFRDTIAYKHKRGIYLIRDKKTGQEFIGVSGVGVAETGSHAAGKMIVADER
jgi:hypothetical protein